MIRKRAVRNSDEADMLRFPRTIRLDPSDTLVFERAAEPGEWAVSGAFVFWNQDLATLGQKQRVALRSGFLGIDSFGWSTLAIVTEATEAERQGTGARQLCGHGKEPPPRLHAFRGQPRPLGHRAARYFDKRLIAPAAAIMGHAART